MLKLICKHIVAISVFAFLSILILTGKAQSRVDPPELEEIRCMALNIYHESKWQSIEGKRAVAYVVMNRVRSNKYPNNVCDVIFQGPTRPSWRNQSVQIPVRNMCQFSWWCDGKSDEVRNIEKYKECFFVAIQVLGEYGTRYEKDPTNGSLWYHADYVDPHWNDIYRKEVVIGAHIFYSNGSK